MSFFDAARKALLPDNDYNDSYDSRDDENYEDEYEDDDLDREDYDEDSKPKRRLFSFLSRDKEYDYDSQSENDYDEVENTSSKQRYSNRRTTSSSNSYSKTTKEYNPPKTFNGVEVIVLHPTSFDESAKLVHEVKDGKITVIDVSEVPSTDEARRIIDYIGGAAEGMDCPFDRICPSIFCLAPKGVKITTKKSKY